MSNRPLKERLRNKRIRLFQADPHCHYCGCVTHYAMYQNDVPVEHRHNIATLDHIVPQSHGGRHTNDNLVLACKRCNHSRGSIPYDEFKAMVEAQKALHGVVWTPEFYKHCTKRRAKVNWTDMHHPRHWVIKSPFPHKTGSKGWVFSVDYIPNWCYHGNMSMEQHGPMEAIG